MLIEVMLDGTDVLKDRVTVQFSIG